MLLELVCIHDIDPKKANFHNTSYVLLRSAFQDFL